MDNKSFAPFTLFSVVWAFAAFFHYHAFDLWAQGYYVLPAVLWLLMKPSCAKRLLLLALLELVEAATSLPLKNNHWLFMTFVNAALLISACKEYYYHKSLFDPKRLLRRFAPYGRCMLILLYFFAVLHKLNIDFFDLGISCGAKLYHEHALKFAFLPNDAHFGLIAIYGTLVIETAIPLSLAIKKTRTLGIFMALLFHGIIGFNPMSQFWNFSASIFGALALFIPLSIAEQIVSLFQRGKLILICVLATSAIAATSLAQFGIMTGGLTLWGIYFIAVTWLYLWGWGRAYTYATDDFSWKRGYAHLLTLALFVNGMSPYLGLKTEGSFAMFSNLSTEQGKSNHFFISEKIQLFDFQKDLVEIQQSDDTYLSQLAKQELLLPFFAFREYVHTHPNTHVVFKHNGKREPMPMAQQTIAIYRRAPISFGKNF